MSRKRVCISIDEVDYQVLRSIGGSDAISSYLEYRGNDVYYHSERKIFTTLHNLIYYKVDLSDWLFIGQLHEVSDKVLSELVYEL